MKKHANKALILALVFSNVLTVKAMDECAGIDASELNPKAEVSAPAPTSKEVDGSGVVNQGLNITNPEEAGKAPEGDDSVAEAKSYFQTVKGWVSSVPGKEKAKKAWAYLFDDKDGVLNAEGRQSGKEFIGVAAQRSAEGTCVAYAMYVLADKTVEFLPVSKLSEKNQNRLKAIYKSGLPVVAVGADAFAQYKGHGLVDYAGNKVVGAVLAAEIAFGIYNSGYASTVAKPFIWAGNKMNNHRYATGSILSAGVAAGLVKYLRPGTFTKVGEYCGSAYDYVTGAFTKENRDKVTGALWTNRGWASVAGEATGLCAALYGMYRFGIARTAFGTFAGNATKEIEDAKDGDSEVSTSEADNKTTLKTQMSAAVEAKALAEGQAAQLTTLAGQVSPEAQALVESICKDVSLLSQVAGRTVRTVKSRIAGNFTQLEALLS